jgi:hypothetical protein
LLSEYSHGNQAKRDGERKLRNVYKILARNSERKAPHGRSRFGDNIAMDLKEMGCKHVN